jgi:energy-coupling factor transporter ATP-binding protein EcfA2
MSIRGELSGLFGYRRNEVLLLIGHVIGIGIAGFVVFDMVAMGWHSNNPIYSLVYFIIGILDLPPEGAFSLLIGICAGLLLTVIWKDKYKRFQTVILISLALPSITYLSNRYGLLLENISWSKAANAVFLIAGLAVGGGIGVLPVSKTKETQPKGPERLDHVPKVILGVGILSVVSGILGTYIFPGAGQSTIPADEGLWLVHMVGSGVFLPVLYTYLSYESDRNILILGPTGSGKSTLMAGLSKSISEESTSEYGAFVDIDTNNALDELVDDIDRNDGDLNVASNAMDNILPLRMKYLNGKLFPKVVEIKTIDYAGAHLTGRGSTEHDGVEVKNKGESKTQNWKKKIYDIIPGLNKYDGMEIAFQRAEEKWRGEGQISTSEVVDLVEDMLYYSDSVGFIFPMEDFIPDGTALPEYLKHIEIVEKKIKEHNRDDLSAHELIAYLYNSHGVPPETVKAIAENKGLNVKVPDDFYSVAAEYETKDNSEIEQITVPPRERASVKEYTKKYKEIAEGYPKKDKFIVATKADYAKEMVEYPPANNWEGFRSRIYQNCIWPKNIHVQRADSQSLIDDFEKSIYPVYYDMDTDNPINEEGHLNSRWGEKYLGVTLTGSRKLLKYLGR